MSDKNLGEGVYLVEGVVEADPASADRFIIRTVNAKGEPFSFDVQQVLSQVKGQEIRLVIAPLPTVQELERIVKQQQAEGESVVSGEKSRGN